MMILIDDKLIARETYNMWDNVWFPGDPEVGGADVLSPYPYDIIIDKNGFVVFVDREYEPDKIVQHVEELLGNEFVKAEPRDDVVEIQTPRLKISRKGDIKAIQVFSRGKVESFKMYSLQGASINLFNNGGGIYSGANLSSGVYFYLYIVDGANHQGKIILP